MSSIHIYRKLLRSAAIAFKGDIPMLKAAKKEIRTQMENSKTVRDLEELEMLRASGNEAADFLRTMVVQATVNESGNLQMALAKDHLGKVAEPILPGMDLPRLKRGKR